ncbi:MAG TPA: cupin domain-containing protein [Nocardioidaceae bacterium]|nr:cupin domain-containing protein [Nocardioidaceae bacterium]
MPVIRAADAPSVELPGRTSANPLPAALGRAAGVSLRVVEIPPGPRTPHRHPHSCEVVYVAAGRGRVWEGERSTSVAPGDVVLVEPGVPHATVCTSAEPMRLVCFFPHPDLGDNIEEMDAELRT